MDWLLSLPTYILLFATLYFEVFLIYTYIEDKTSFSHKKLSKRLPGGYPSVTILVPAWNEEKTLSNTITSLLSLEYPKNKLSLFIINDGSTDGTLAVANSFADNPQVTVFTKENGGKHTAMNLGISHANSELIGCLDADSFVEKNALKEIVEVFRMGNDIMAVTPSVQIHFPTNWLQKIQSIEYMMGQFMRKVLSRIHGLYVTPGPFSFYRKEVFERIGGFKHAYGTEDMEMAMRMQKNHMRIENAHSALVHTVSPRTIPTLYKQRVRWVSGFLKNAFYDYRHMFLNKKYGDFGFLVFPFGLVSIFSALFFSTQYIRLIGTALYNRYIEYSVLGFHFSLPSLEWFSFNLEFQRLIIYLLVVVTLLFIVIGMLMVKRKLFLSSGLIYFVFLYGLIAPFWLAKSVYNLVLGQNARWR
ncbi:MAG: glycosyltransferase [Candidatus Paceibacterota bacterium]